MCSWEALRQEQGETLNEELQVFQAVQSKLVDACHQSREHPMCTWYSTDISVTRAWIRDGYVDPLPFP
jgi:hypothetical protein